MTDCHVLLHKKSLRSITPARAGLNMIRKKYGRLRQAYALEAITKAGLESSDIAAIGITNQRETTVVWNRSTGRPVYNAIVWQDRRTADYCDQMNSEGKSRTILEKTGLVIDAYFSATKIKWILE